MYLAGILGLCALLHVPASGYVSSGSSFFASEEISIPGWNQEPAGTAPSSPTPKQEQPKPDGSQAAPQGSQPVESPPPPQTSNPPAITPVPSAAPSLGSEKSSPSTPKKHARKKKKKRSSGAPGQPPQKKVVRRGSTGEPTTKLAPSITEEQAARQREHTNQLLVSTDASLQKLSGRQLSKDEQETVVQIRKFMEQVKTADAAGDLQRAYKLAVKAHLLSDALAKP
jgi:outer membrane biosynthesis protein TonB